MYEKTNYQKNFFGDVKDANRLENILADLMESQFDCTATPTHSTHTGSFPDYDIAVKFHDGNEDITIELKDDRRAMQTMNVAIEHGRVHQDGKQVAKGLSVTKASVWVQHFNNTFYFIPVDTLKELVKSYEVKRGGDGERSLLYIVPIKEFVKHAMPLNRTPMNDPRRKRKEEASHNN